MAVESLRRRRFGTEVSSIWITKSVFLLLNWVSVRADGSLRRATNANVSDGTEVIDVARVTRSNCEVIAT
jgi:hypothetical protein